MIEILCAAAFKFMAWTYMLYWTHRFAHWCGLIFFFHKDHHQQVDERVSGGFNWNNLYLWNDTLVSTIDLWITDVIPTILFAWLFDCWWIALFYYLWASLIQERIEHNEKFSAFPWLISGQWHLVHHKFQGRNFGSFVWFWDRLHETEAKL